MHGDGGSKEHPCSLVIILFVAQLPLQKVIADLHAVDLNEIFLEIELLGVPNMNFLVADDMPLLLDKICLIRPSPPLRAQQPKLDLDLLMLL